MIQKITISKKAFSLIEIIFAIAIMTVITVVALPKFGDSIDKANIIKIKTDIMLIRNGLVEYKDKMILSNTNTSLISLESETSSDLLFDIVLKYPIISSEIDKSTSWSKLSDNSYKVWINSTEYLIFNYDNTKLTFDCNLNDAYCEELTQ